MQLLHAKALISRTLRTAALCLCGCFVFGAAISLAVSAIASRYVYTNIDALPQRAVAVVLGTTPYVISGGMNPYFTARMDAAAELYRKGKVSELLISGDNRDFRYNEPKAMRKALEADGVPPQAIHEDFAGLDTLDSVLRARDVFGIVAPIYVTQRFHADRALAIARWNGIPAIAYIAHEPQLPLVKLKLYTREYFARIKMAYQLLAGTGPSVRSAFAPFYGGR